MSDLSDVCRSAWRGSVLISITGRGYDNLDPGVIGTLTNTINFAGQPSTTTVTSVTGNGSTYTFGNMGVFFVNQPTASNPVLIIDQGLTLTNPVWGTGFLSLDSLDLTLADAPASVPEPASLAILSVGLAGFAALKRRRTT